MAAQRFVAVVEARVLPEQWVPQVAAVVRHFVDRAWGLGTGGARGADQYALAAVVATGGPACARSVVYLPAPVGAARTEALAAFQALGGRIVPGTGQGRTALLGRSARLARTSSGVVAFLWGPSRGSVFTVREAIRAGKPAAVVLAGGGAELPSFPGGRWVACVIGAVAAYRWVPDPAVPDEPERQLTALGRIFVVPEGEPVQGLMEHIASLSQGERLWFERGVLMVDTVMVPHEALSDTPAFLAVPRLMRRFRCSVKEAVGLAELFLALDVGPAVVTHYEREAARRGIQPVIEDLVHLVARAALAEEMAAGDALEEAERLGEWVDDLDGEGHVGPVPAPATGSGEASLAWHALGAVQVDITSCPACGERYECDDDTAELPRCPACGTRDEWESRQGATYRALVGEIDACLSLTDLAGIGKRLYALRLPHDQAGVAWTHYHLRRQRLEGAVTLGPAAHALVARIQAAPDRALPRLGAELYRRQRAGAAITPAEWGRVWRAYRARRPRAA